MANHFSDLYLILLLLPLTVTNLNLISTAESPPPPPSLPTTVLPSASPPITASITASPLPSSTSTAAPPTPSPPATTPPTTSPPAITPPLPPIAPSPLPYSVSPSPPPSPPAPNLAPPRPNLATPPPPNSVAPPPPPSPSPLIIATPPIPPPPPSQPNIASPPPPPPSAPKNTTSTRPRPPPTVPGDQQQQMRNIIDALIGAGDFGSWAGFLSTTGPSTLPLTATLFIPNNDALSHLPTPTPASPNFDPFLIPYHIVPQRFSFSELQLFQTHTRLPTLLPSRTILITNNSLSNFTIDDSPITYPDLYIATAVTVHGIETILDYATYGGSLFSPPDPMPTPPHPQAEAPPFFPTGDNMGRRRSDAACLCTEFPIIFSVVCAAFAFKIHRNPLAR